MRFYAIYHAYEFFALLMAIIVCSLSYLTLAQLKAKGKGHYRAWLLPFTLGNTVAMLIMLAVVVRLLLHIRLTASIYYSEYAAQAVIFIFGIYGSARLWQSVNNSPLAPPPMPAHAPREESQTVWPPSPRPPGNDQ